MFWLFVSSALAFTANGDNGSVQHACTPGETVNLNGQSNTVSLTGDCGRVNVNGGTNTVTIDGLSKLSVTGSQNQITWSRNLSGKRRLPVTNTGLQNTISQR